MKKNTKIVGTAVLAALLLILAFFVAACKGGDPSLTTEDSNFTPGVILVGLKEPIKESFSEMFPDLSIEEVIDYDLRLYESIKDTPGMETQSENAKSRIGTNFAVKITQKSKSALLEAIAVITDDPRVAYAHPDYYDKTSD